MSADIIKFNLSVDLSHEKEGQIDLNVDKTLYADKLLGRTLYVEQKLPKLLNINTITETRVEL